MAPRIFLHARHIFLLLLTFNQFWVYDFVPPMLALNIRSIRKMVCYEIPSFPMNFDKSFKFFILKFGWNIWIKLFLSSRTSATKFCMETTLTSSLFHLPRFIFFFPWREADPKDGVGDIVSDSESESMSGSPRPSIFWVFLGSKRLKMADVSLARYTNSALSAYKMLALPSFPFLVLSLPRSAGSFFSETTLARVL